jgi:hypothetical protein
MHRGTYLDLKDDIRFNEEDVLSKFHFNETPLLKLLEEMLKDYQEAGLHCHLFPVTDISDDV